MNRTMHLLFSSFCLFISCQTSPKNDDKASSLIEILNDSNSNRIMIVAHRGDWRNAPENSLQAIQNCIDMGIDMVEIDVRKTKNDVLILMHDQTLNRTTTGKGLVSEWSLDSLQTLYLKNGINQPTKHKIPTLKEALELIKGNILVNLDKCYNYFPEVYNVIKETGTEDQVVLKGSNLRFYDVKEYFGSKLDSVLFMPIINLDKQKNASDIIDEFQEKLKPVAFELVFSNDTSQVLDNFSKIKLKGSKIWVNALWGSLNAGYEDDLAMENPDSIYGWYISKGINIIQTDRPELLLNYLRDKGLH